VIAPSPGDARSGLSADEVALRLAAHGPNALPEPRPEPHWRRLLRHFRSPLIYILLFALAVDLVVWTAAGRAGVPVEAMTIGAILVLNALLGFWQERKAEDALAELGRLAAPQAWVLRDGALARVPSRDLVPGDLVRLEAGDRVPADALALDDPVAVDESLLTGESLPVDRDPGAELAAGTLVVRGRCYATVIRTGLASAMGRVAALLGRVRQEPTPLEKRLDAFGRRVAIVVTLLAVALVVVGTMVEGVPRLAHVLLFAVALAVAAVPEGLPAILTFTLALGVQRMARRHAVVRRLSAVEALGSVTVIATDKTGTLTENRIEVRDLDAPAPADALRAMVLANDAESGAGVGDPVDLALLSYAAAHGVDLAALLSAHPRKSSRPFDSATRSMRVTVAAGERTESYVKGAPESVLEACGLSAEARASWLAKTHAYAMDGYRPLALARADGEDETRLEFLGLALLWDPPRPEVRDAVGQARSAGIRVIMVTGDHPTTALVVARTVGISDTGVVTGAELDRMDDDALARSLRDTSVFARVSPEHKLRIVEVLKRQGEIVAMTGDGVNDAPALKRADVGIAMGLRGSDVSREVADLVLLDDNFATIVHAVEEGRSIYENVQKFVRFLFSTNLAEVLVVTIGAMIAVALNLREASGAILLPLTAAQILFINLVTDGAPALALGLDRNRGVMRRPPRPPDSPLLDAPSLSFVLLAGTTNALVALVLLGLLPAMGQSREVARTATFAFLGAGQQLFAYTARRSGVAPSLNIGLHLAVVLGFAVQLGVVAVPQFRGLFDAVGLPPVAWVAVATGILVSWGLAELVSLVSRRWRVVPEEGLTGRSWRS